jgi:hypothetical protein
MSTYIQSAVSNSIGLGINVYKTGNNVGIVNVGIGGNVFNNNSTGNFNTGIGANVFASNVSGSYNTGIGANSGNSILGSYSTSLGSNAGQAPGDTNVYNNSTAIGYGAVVNASGQIVMGTANEYVTIPSTSGGLVVGGGVAIGGDLNVSGNIFINGLLAGTTTTGSSNLNFGSNPLTAGAVSANSLNLAGGATTAVTAGNMSIGTVTSGSLNAGTNPLTSGNMSVGTIVGGLANATSLSTGSITVGNVFASTVTGGNLSILGIITAGPLNVTSALTGGNMSVGTIVGGATSLLSLSVGAISAGSVSTGNLTCGVMTVGTVTAGNLTLGTNALTGGNMSVGIITVGGLTVTSVSTGTVTAGTLTIGTNPLTVGNITVGTITSGSQNMATNPLTAGNVSTGAVTVGNLNANATVTATSISAGTVTAGSISTGTLSCAYLSAFSYTPAITIPNYNFGTNPLTAGSISVGTIVSNSVNLGGNSLFVGGISVGTVTAGAINLAGNSLTAGNIISVGSITSTSHNMGNSQLTAGNLSGTTIYGSGMGIATASPAYTLDVNGNVNCTGGYYVYGGNALSTVLDGSSRFRAATSAKYIQQTFSQYNDGVYWINLPTVGPTQIYCIMNPAYAGGGWMLAMKGTQGTTFNFSSNYWTTNNTLNPTDTTRIAGNDADAKFHTFNYFPATDWLAIFPDTGISGGDLPASLGNGWIWVENNAVGESIPVSTWFSLGIQITKLSNNVAYYGTNPQPIYSQKYSSSVWSNETGMQFYGMNYTGCAVSYCRWGFNFNNETDQNSNDARGGIGIQYQNNNALGTNIYASAGDFYYCCGTPGLNRAMRFEWYVR